MRLIKLTRGKAAIVDDEDFEWLNKFKWYANSYGYAVRNIQHPNGKRRILLMHRVIMNTPTGMETDHRDHNPLNNQKSNLRVCTPSQNQMNKTKPKSAGSKFKGVHITICEGGKYKYFRSMTVINGKRLYKYFPFTPEGEIQAAKAYNEMAQKHFGEFALVNQISS